MPNRALIAAVEFDVEGGEWRRRSTHFSLRLSRFKKGPAIRTYSSMKSYYRVMLGKGSVHAAECFAGNFIGADFGIDQDLSPKLTEQWRDFNHEFVPVYLAAHPGKSRIGAGLACGALWAVSKGIAVGDIVLCPNGLGRYRIGEVAGDYYYQPGTFLPHRRPVRWLEQGIDRADMSPELKSSTGSVGTVSTITGYSDEIEKWLVTVPVASPGVVSPVLGDLASFAMEKHLEDFLVQNWAHTDLGKDYDIYEEDAERLGQQYPTDTGRMDILAISKDKKSLLVVELKRGKASDAVVGQILRYMGYVKEELAEAGQSVAGAIIALEDDPRIRRALAMVQNVSFYRYQVSFKLVKS